ncbi:TetR/AcrR family transcriptional regulator [Ramlibacter sp.]|uniref:TetR/AcrR family transcriptional regulator n=1 Tax=Ramlibacter sp. TaxID=1917967 RepID=UPI002BD290EF|nr:TetR/AcrR family transcriptional regulator [Ramlibacter sp.]HWI84609.1 TetR/AcrR family transcriptional regulator [Ramlibacter sp.]
MSTAATRLPTADRQAEIVTAALALAREASPALITTADIAADVGVTQGALFKHFPTKDAIWLAAMGWVREQLLSTLERAVARAGSPLDALAGMFKAHVGFVASHPGVPRFIFHELQRPADSPIKQEVRKLLQGYRKMLRKQLDAAVAIGEVSREVDLDAAATLFVGVVQGLVMQSMLSGNPAAIKSQADAVFAIYRRGLQEAP